MALTKEQADQLAQLEAERDAPPVRTGHGLAGILHTLIDLVSGRVAHISPDVVDELHGQAEELAGGGEDQAADTEPAVEDQAAGDSKPAE